MIGGGIGDAAVRPPAERDRFLAAALPTRWRTRDGALASADRASMLATMIELLELGETFADETRDGFGENLVVLGQVDASVAGEVVELFKSDPGFRGEVKWRRLARFLRERPDWRPIVERVLRRCTVSIVDMQPYLAQITTEWLPERGGAPDARDPVREMVLAGIGDVAGSFVVEDSILSRLRSGIDGTQAGLGLTPGRWEIPFNRNLFVARSNASFADVTDEDVIQRCREHVAGSRFYRPGRFEAVLAASVLPIRRAFDAGHRPSVAELNAHREALAVACRERLCEELHLGVGGTREVDSLGEPRVMVADWAAARARELYTTPHAKSELVDSFARVVLNGRRLVG